VLWPLAELYCDDWWTTRAEEIAETIDAMKKQVCPRAVPPLRN